MIINIYKLIISIIVFSFFAVGSAYASSADMLNVKIQKVVNHYLKVNGKKHGFSAVEVSVLLPNEQNSRNFAAGTVTKESNVPANSSMLIQYGSITKMFTAALILKLIKKNIIHLSDKLGSIFPEKFSEGEKAVWPPMWKNVSIRELLNMTSGIPAYGRTPKIWLKMNPYIAYKKNDLIMLVVNHQKNYGCNEKDGCFMPGTSWFYSNLNYIILGLIVEKYYKMSFSGVMNKYILKSFQKKNIPVYYYLRYPSQIRKKVLPSYFELLMISGNQYVPLGKNVHNIPLYWAASAGAMTGTASGLAQLIRAYYSDKFVNSYLLMNKKNLINVKTGREVYNIKRECKSFCYGFGLETKYDKNIGQIWEYEGGTLGFATYYGWFPNSNIIIVISQNSSSDTSNLEVPVYHIYHLIQKYLKNITFNKDG